MDRRQVLPLLGGLSLVALGVLLLAANLGWLQLDWLLLLKFVFPALFLLVGINKLIRHFTWDEERLVRSPMKSSLLGGVFWAFLGAVLAADILGWTQSLSFLGRWWPLILILFGAGKIVDFYRLPGRFQLRAAEVIGLFFITILGIGCNRLSEAHLPLVLSDWQWPLPIEAREPRHRFESEESFPTAGVAGLLVNNQYGDIRIETGPDDTVRVQLTSVVRDGEEEAARELADRFQLSGGSNDGRLEIGTNRADLGADGKRLNSHLVIQVPRALPVTVRNAYGDVRVIGLQAACQLENDYGAISVTGVRGDLTATTSRQRIDVRDVIGTVKVTNTRGPIRLEDLEGAVEAGTSYESLEGFQITGNVVATNRMGRIRMERIGGTLQISGSGSSVHVSEVDELVDVQQARQIVVSRLGGALRLNVASGEVEMSGVAGPVEIDAVQTRIEGRDLDGGLRFKGVGTQLALERVSGGVRIETTLREVRVEEFSGAVEIQNEFGSIHLEAREALSGPIVAGNRNGEIRVTLPAAAGFELSAQSRGGQVVSDFGETPSRPGDRSVVRATVGGGGPRVDLQTTHSRILVRRQG